MPAATTSPEFTSPEGDPRAAGLATAGLACGSRWRVILSSGPPELLKSAGVATRLVQSLQVRLSFSIPLMQRGRYCAAGAFRNATALAPDPGIWLQIPVPQRR